MNVSLFPNSDFISWQIFPFSGVVEFVSFQSLTDTSECLKKYASCSQTDDARWVQDTSKSLSPVSHAFLGVHYWSNCLCYFFPHDSVFNLTALLPVFVVHTMPLALTLCISPMFPLHIDAICELLILTIPKDRLCLLCQKGSHLCNKRTRQEKPCSLTIFFFVPFSFQLSSSSISCLDFYHITFVLPLFVKSPFLVWMCSWTSSNSFACHCSWHVWHILQCTEKCVLM